MTSILLLLIAIKTFACVIAIDLKPVLRPNLPAGEFRIKFKGFTYCRLTDHDPIQFNLYFSKKSLKDTEVKGNLTFLVPFDNSLFMEANFAVKGSTGGWINNAHVIPMIGRVCDVVKTLIGPKSWNSFLVAFNMSETGCPIKPGVYVSSGLDTEKLLKGDFFAKQFFYGDYKITVKFLSSTKKYLGCVSTLTEFVRPWEY